jgi:multicomponent Na+:H+ antiporter subunit D
MLTAIAAGSALGFAAMAVYLVAHALIKASLFLTAGILLHRSRAVGERALFGKGKKLGWTAAIWFLGAVGLAASPPLLLWVGEAGISKAAESVGSSWISWVCVLGGALTAASVLRVGMHTFFGWGDEPITDEAAEVGELPETPEADRKIVWHLYAPAAFAIVAAIALAVYPGWIQVVCDASATYTSQQSVLHAIYTGAPLGGHVPVWTGAMKASVVHGGLALLLAIVLACTSVFRRRLPRYFRAGAFLESGVPFLRTMQSGHPGDYVLWLTIGLAFVAGATLWLRP